MVRLEKTGVTDWNSRLHTKYARTNFQNINTTNR